MTDQNESSESYIELSPIAQRHLQESQTEQESPSYENYTKNINNGNPTFDVPEDTEVSEDTGWWLSEGVKGEGEKPEYFNDKTFKTLADQAKAHQDLLKMKSKSKELAPETYDYEVGEEYDIDQYGENLLNSFADTCRKNNISQNQFTSILDDYISNLSLLNDQKEKEDFQKLLDEKKMLGPDADAKLTTMKQWSESTMPPDIGELFSEIMCNTKTFKLGEYFMNNMGYNQMPINSESSSNNIKDRHLKAREMMRDHKYGRDTDFTKMVDAEYRKLAEVGAFEK